MPKNTACPGVPRVTNPITDQEIAFAHLVLSGTMTDRRAAEAVGLNPETAAYTKAKPRVRAYMLEHRAAVKEKLVDQEADGLRKLNLGRDQIHPATPEPGPRRDRFHLRRGSPPSRLSRPVLLPARSSCTPPQKAIKAEFYRIL